MSTDLFQALKLMLRIKERVEGSSIPKSGGQFINQWLLLVLTRMQINLLICILSLDTVYFEYIIQDIMSLWYVMGVDVYPKKTPLQNAFYTVQDGKRCCSISKLDTSGYIIQSQKLRIYLGNGFTETATMSPLQGSSNLAKRFSRVDLPDRRSIFGPSLLLNGPLQTGIGVVLERFGTLKGGVTGLELQRQSELLICHGVDSRYQAVLPFIS